MAWALRRYYVVLAAVVSQKFHHNLQSDIRQRKKIVICEHCGRINVDAEMAGIVEEVVEEKPKSRRRKKA